MAVTTIAVVVAFVLRTKTPLGCANRGVLVTEGAILRQASINAVDVTVVTAHKAVLPRQTETSLEVPELTRQPSILTMAINAERTKG